jgi:hypothetical protein
MSTDVYRADWDPAEALAGDGGGVALRRITDALSQGQGALKAKLDRGVAPDEFKRGQALLESYTAAMRGVERAWEQRNKA